MSAVDGVLVARATGAPSVAPTLGSPHPVRATTTQEADVTGRRTVSLRAGETVVVVGA
ncbi:hypothetical protein [Xylanimonas sp. McL0601]|uniref:hypothetical protein n=1 Tax=Xylanimonas sp. McL0601 TaxID=3414739 RepID=UPI003CF25899